MTIDVNTQKVILTPKLEQEIVNAYKKRERKVDIVERYGISTGTLYRILDAYSVKRVGGNRGRTKAILENFSEKNKVDIYTDYMRGRKLVDIYSTYNINKNALYVIIDQFRANGTGDYIERQLEKELEAEYGRGEGEGARVRKPRNRQAQPEPGFKNSNSKEQVDLRDLITE